ncbi:hypothetical protein EV426DRAFT_711199 [Tirmania nivea]|nr:hypothetical protein EV426DRAFT_711199 [Tirmania nivea]
MSTILKQSDRLLLGSITTLQTLTGNAPGYLDSDDESELEKAGIEAARKWEGVMRNQLSKDDWRRLFEKEEEQDILEHVAGLNDCDDHSGRDMVSYRLEEYRDEREKLREEVDRLEEGSEEINRKKVLLKEQLRISEERTGEVPTMKAELQKFDHFLANFAGCSTRRPVDTLLAAAQKKVEKMSRSKSIKIRELEKSYKELEVAFDNLCDEAKADDEDLSEARSKISSLKMELEDAKALVIQLKSQLEAQVVEKNEGRVKMETEVKTIDKGIQVSVKTADTSTQSDPFEKQRKERERKEKGEAKGKRKGKERAKDSVSAGDTPPAKNKKKEDEEMGFSLYEDLSDYEKEVEEIVKDEAPVTPPVTQKQPIVRQGSKIPRCQTQKASKASQR